MATIEKPKQKKKRKTKQLDIDTTYLAEIDIDFPTTSASDEIPTHECSVSAVLSKPEANTDVCKNATISQTEISKLKVDDNFIEQDSNNDVVKQIKNKDEKYRTSDIQVIDELTMIEPIIEASAPPATATTENLILENMEKLNIKYPNLQVLSKIENNTTVFIQHERQQNQTLPFTNQQLMELYHNPKYETSQLFENEFIHTELNANYRNHILYDYLTNYFKMRFNLKMNAMDLEGIRKKCNQDPEKFWSINTKRKEICGNCKDDNIVKQWIEYEIAELNNDALMDVSKHLNDMLNLVCCNYSLNLYNAEINKILIEHYIKEIINRSELSDIINSDSIQINDKYMNEKVLATIQEIRISISIIFYFLRRTLPDKIFQADLRLWLEKLIAVQLRVATWRDHLFLIYHILRCPAGIGKWTAAFIQIPKPQLNAIISPFLNNEINYCMTFLSVILLPVKERSKFLDNLHNNSYSCINSDHTSSEQHAIDVINNELWILVDSDGDEDDSPTGEVIGLKEADLIAFLNQVPFEQLFSVLVFAENNNGNTILNENNITGTHLLKFIAFATNLVQLLGEGLKTYDTERYKQFSKILSRLVKHSVQYVSDLYDIFKSGLTEPFSVTTIPTTSAPNFLNNDIIYLYSRINMEYDIFVIRASYYIYKSRNIGTWQYLANLPYSKLCLNSIWKLYYALNVGFEESIILSNDDFREKVFDVEFRNCFKDKIIDIPAEYMYYLLQTFSSMILSRDINIDMKCIEKITLDLFEIGYINKTTKENCYKIIRDLLVNILSLHPQLISSIILIIKDNLKMIDESVIYLFKFLPLNNWLPTIYDFEITATWLLNFHYESIESILARTIFYRLNWNFDENNELFLSHDIHIRMACLIAEASGKHVPEIIGSSGISESVRQVSNLVSGYTPTQQFITWCWNLISLLRLHNLDQNNDTKINTIKNPSHLLCVIPDVERLEAISLGVSDLRPLSIYLSILTSSWGHSVPEICHKGFQQIQLLLNDYRHSIVIRCLHLITPLFMECPESLCKCEKFQLILNQLLSSDRTYLRMAKEFITSNNRGPVIELFGNMLQSQIISYNSDYGLSSPVSLTNMWLQCLTHIQNWNKNSNAMYLIDLTLRIAFLFPDAWYSAKEYFKYIFKRVEDVKPTKSTFLPFLSNNNGSQNTSMPMLYPNALWLSFLCLEIDHELFELQNKFWSELLRQLRLVVGKFSMDNIIKKTANIIGCSPFSSNDLVLYKLINLIIMCPYEHHLLPIICQKFFYLFLARIPLNDDELNTSYIYGVADKFYESNIPLMKKLKNYFIDGSNYYKKQVLIETDNDFIQILNARFKIFGSFALWLEENRLNTIIETKYHNNFPLQYDLHRLELIFTRNERYWTELIHFPAIRQLQIDASNCWLKNCFRYNINKKNTPLSSVSSHRDERSAKENIIQHIRSYDAPILPPKIAKESLHWKNLTSHDLNKDVLLQKFILNFKKLDKLAENFQITTKDLKSMNCNYIEWIKYLYSNENIQRNRSVTCSSRLSTKECSGAGIIKYIVSQPKLYSYIKLKLLNNRECYDNGIESLVLQPICDNVLPIAETQLCIRQLIEMYNNLKQKPNDKQFKLVCDIGIQFFYITIDNYSESLILFPSSNDFCTQALVNLGIIIRDNQQTEGIKLLQRAFKYTKLIKIISELFVPSFTEPKYFLEMYEYIIDSHMKKCDTKIIFVLLSKFDIINWLINFKPKLIEINQLIKYIICGLESWNQSNSKMIQGILRRHLIHIFEYDFPEHYGEVFQLVLNGCSEQKLKPSVLIDLLNSIYEQSGCNKFKSQKDNLTQKENIQNIINFATNQKIFTYKDIEETMSLLARHFQNERLQFGLHGLYPKHKDYCDIIILILRSFSSALMVSAVYAYPGILGEKLVEILWMSYCNTYGPWLIPYYPQFIENTPTSNWLKQMMPNNQLLLPWSDLHVESSNKLLTSFIDGITFLLDTLPPCDSILGHIFSWYDVYFTSSTIPKYILIQIHTSLIVLPWDKFKPIPHHIQCFHKILQQFLPDCHSFVGQIFLKIQWSLWLSQNIQLWDYQTKQKVLSSLLLIILKMSSEPNVREDLHFLTILKQTINYPWSILEYQSIESIMEWFIMSNEPSIILRLSSEYEAIDNGVFELLQNVFAMSDLSDLSISTYNMRAKRLLYVKKMIRLLRICCSKYQPLLLSEDGVKSFQSAVHRLLNMIENTLKNVKNEGDRETETIGLMTEIISLVLNQNQSEFSSKLFIEAIIIWQSTCEIGSKVMCSILNAVGTCKEFTYHVLMLLEATIFSYFKCLETSSNTHNPNWEMLIKRLGTQLPPTIELKQFVNGQYLFSLHIFAIYQLRKLSNSGEQITFLQNLHQLLENFKTNEITESKLLILWGLITASGYQILQYNANSKKPLLTLGRYLQTISNYSDGGGWGDGILGAIGLRKDSISNKRRILTRCLSCIIFSLFPDTVNTMEIHQPCQEYYSALDEFKNIINTKRYTDVKVYGLLALDLIEKQPKDLTKTVENICSIFKLFYKENFVTTLENVWKFY